MNSHGGKNGGNIMMEEDLRLNGEFYLSFQPWPVLQFHVLYTVQFTCFGIVRSAKICMIIEGIVFCIYLK